MSPNQSIDWMYKSVKAQQPTRNTPLICWDFYVEEFNKISKFITDKELIQKIALKQSWSVDKNWIQNIPLNTVIVVTNPSLEIVFVTENLVTLNGYKPEEVLGATPRMFQGKDTCTTTSKEIGMAIKNQQPFDKTVLNYCKDGSIYHCHIKGFPIFDKKGKLQNFVALERAA
jgi:PAS domain S-box-containing protein